MYYGLFAYEENHSEPQSQFRKIIEKYKKTPNTDFSNDITYIQSNKKALSKEKLTVKAQLLHLLAKQNPNLIIKWIKNNKINEIEKNSIEKKLLLLAIIDTF